MNISELKEGTFYLTEKYGSVKLIKIEKENLKKSWGTCLVETQLEDYSTVEEELSPTELLAEVGRTSWKNHRAINNSPRRKFVKSQRTLTFI